MNCKKCNQQMKFGEGWIDYEGEQRHAEYYICPKCESVYNINGELVSEFHNRNFEIQLTFVTN